MPAVSANQNRDRPVSSRPLSGITVGSTTSKAEIRSDATRSSRPSRQLVQVADLARSQEVVSAASGTLGLAIEVVPRRRHSGASSRPMTSGTCCRNAARRSTRRARRATACGDGRVDREQVAQRRPLVRGAQRGALDDRVRLLARQAAAAPRGRRARRRGVEAEAARDVLAHPLGADHEPLDQAGHPHEHVVEDDRGVGQDDALGARVADVALVPERLVLEGGAARTRAGGGPARRSAPTGSGCACGASPTSPSGRP